MVIVETKTIRPVTVVLIWCW